MKDIFFLLFLVLASIMAIVGWIANIVKLFHMTVDPVTTELILRIIGIPFGPLGAVMGFM